MQCTSFANVFFCVINVGAESATSLANGKRHATELSACCFMVCQAAHQTDFGTNSDLVSPVQRGQVPSAPPTSHAMPRSWHASCQHAHGLAQRDRSADVSCHAHLQSAIFARLNLANHRHWNPHNQEPLSKRNAAKCSEAKPYLHSHTAARATCVEISASAGCLW